MSEVADRNFNTFQLGDNVYELASGLIPETAEYFGMKLAGEPNSEELGQLVGKIGRNKVLRDNEEVIAIDRNTQIELVERSGVQHEMDRSLWTPKTGLGNVDALVLTGAVANWQDRGARVAVNKLAFEDSLDSRSYSNIPLYYVSGSRIMDTATESTHLRVERFHTLAGRYPTEAEYAASIVVPSMIVRMRNGNSGRAYNPNFIIGSYTTKIGDEIASELFKDNPVLLERSIAFARVANAGVQMAVQMRKAAQNIDPNFDNDPHNPQVYVVTDSFPLAEDEKQEAQPGKYQKAATALRQVALTAKMLHEATGGE